jgi:hypothetical protein
VTTTITISLTSPFSSIPTSPLRLCQKSALLL